MKKPREILFIRHQAATPKLDTIRREVVNAAADVNRRKPVREFTFAATLAKAVAIPFHELIWPCRRTWSALAAIWILIFIVNFSQHDKSEMMARKASPPSPQMFLVFRQQERLLDELTGQNEPQTVEPPKTFSPRPDSERRFEILTT
jgi:hypothetical protein